MGRSRGEAGREAGRGRIRLVELTVCVYCGVASDSIDHVVPQHLLARAGELELDLSGIMRMAQWTVPSCRECNAILGGRLYATLAERRKAAHDGLRRKYATYLRTPDWDEDELAEMGESMRQFIRAGMGIRNWVRARLRWTGGSTADVAPVFELSRALARRQGK